MTGAREDSEPQKAGRCDGHRSALPIRSVYPHATFSIGKARLPPGGRAYGHKPDTQVTINLGLESDQKTTEPKVLARLGEPYGREGISVDDIMLPAVLVNRRRIMLKELKLAGAETSEDDGCETDAEAMSEIAESLPSHDPNDDDDDGMSIKSDDDDDLIHEETEESDVEVVDGEGDAIDEEGAGESELEAQNEGKASAEESDLYADTVTAVRSKPHKKKPAMSAMQMYRAQRREARSKLEERVRFRAKGTRPATSQEEEGQVGESMRWLKSSFDPLLHSFVADMVRQILGSILVVKAWREEGELNEVKVEDQKRNVVKRPAEPSEERRSKKVKVEDGKTRFMRSVPKHH
ncbi:hypothetical protein OHC33_005893 [Knufia fluminis]|uniref:Uncharacterized protein n=1 Tax=Knufia fluminis TaxID=191047 RepID=A0AAN8EPP6_9EURO|nr:hypothetical protein OHC33_005893 [Knufia fluminis]